MAKPLDKPDYLGFWAHFFLILSFILFCSLLLFGGDCIETTKWLISFLFFRCAFYFIRLLNQISSDVVFFLLVSNWLSSWHYIMAETARIVGRRIRYIDCCGSSSQIHFLLAFNKIWCASSRPSIRKNPLAPHKLAQKKGHINWHFFPYRFLTIIVIWIEWERSGKSCKFTIKMHCHVVQTWKIRCFSLSIPPSNRYRYLFIWISNFQYSPHILQTPAINLKWTQRQNIFHFTDVCESKANIAFSFLYVWCVSAEARLNTHANIAADLFTLHHRHIIYFMDVYIEFSSHRFTICLPLASPILQIQNHAHKENDVNSARLRISNIHN